MISSQLHHCNTLPAPVPVPYSWWLDVRPSWLSCWIMQDVRVQACKTDCIIDCLLLSHLHPRPQSFTEDCFTIILPSLQTDRDLPRVSLVWLVKWANLWAINTEEIRVVITLIENIRPAQATCNHNTCLSLTPGPLQSSTAPALSINRLPLPLRSFSIVSLVHLWSFCSPFSSQSLDPSLLNLSTC